MAFGLERAAEAYRDDALLQVKTHKRIKGITLTAFAWFLIALSAPYFQSPSNHLSFYNNCFYQFLVAFMSLAAWMSFRGSGYFFSKNPIAIASNSALGMACYWAFFKLRMPPYGQSNSLFLCLDIFFVAAFSTLIIKQKIHSISWFGMILGFFGVVLFASYNVNFVSSKCIIQALFSIVSALAMSLLILSTNYLIRNKNPPLLLCLYNYLFGLLAFGALSLITGFALPLSQDIPYLLISGVLYALAIPLFTKAHYYTEPYLIMPLNLLSPIFLTLTNRYIYGVPVKASVADGLIIVAGLICIIFPPFLKEKNKSKPIEEPIDSAA